MRQFNYEVGDYVRFEGNGASPIEILRNPDTAQIEGFGNDVGNGERVNIFLLTSQQSVWCDFRDIRPIMTNEQYLQKLGFESDIVNNVKRFRRGGLTITGGIIRTPATTYLLNYCVADFSVQPLNINPYLKEDGRLNLEAFFSDYPFVSNLNDLFSFMESQGIEIDKAAIVS